MPIEKTIIEQAEELLIAVENVVKINSLLPDKIELFIDFKGNDVDVVKEVSKIKKSHLHEPDAYFKYYRTMISYNKITVCICSKAFKIETSFVEA